MNLPSEAVSELQGLFKQKFGVSLSEEQAQTEARDLLTLYALAQGQKNII